MKYNVKIAATVDMFTDAWPTDDPPIIDAVVDEVQMSHLLALAKDGVIAVAFEREV